MKIAVISDIHGNPSALGAVLNEIKSFDKIFCLGDLILAGYDPNSAMDMIFKLKDKLKDDFVIIQGNTDKMVANATDKMIEKTKEAFPCMGYSLQDDIKITNPKYIEYVKNLPEKKTLTINGVKIELVHGSPRRQDENIYPDLDNDTVEEMVKDSSADIIFCGHTHKSAGYSLKSGKIVVNAGSVGRSADNDKMPAYVELLIDNDGKILLEHKKAKYDNNLVKRHILARNLKNCEDLVNMF